MHLLKSEMGKGNESLAPVPEKNPTIFVDEDLLYIFVVIFYVTATGTISFSGIVFNIINIIVFIKQGLKDTVNISLFSLAISDTGSLMTLFWMSICFNPAMADPSFPFDNEDFQYLTGGWPHIVFARITSWITAFVTFERCLCIALPLKVKTIMTPKRAIIVIVSIYFMMIACVVPVFYSISFGEKYFPLKNKTAIGLVYIPNGYFIENVSMTITVFAQFAAFLAVIVCTAVLVHNLILKSKWRRKTSTAAKKDSLSQRDKKVVKMVLLISTIFIACFFGDAATFIAMSVVPGFTILGTHRNMVMLTWSVFKTTKAINSMVNIFIYYNMSSKYKEILNKMLHINQVKVEKDA